MHLLGIITDFAQSRLGEIAAKIKRIRADPLGYIQNEQPLRKAVLLEYLDYLRPVLGTEWEHRIEKWKGATKLRKQ